MQTWPPCARAGRLMCSKLRSLLLLRVRSCLHQLSLRALKACQLSEEGPNFRSRATKEDRVTAKHGFLRDHLVRPCVASAVHQIVVGTESKNSDAGISCDTKLHSKAVTTSLWQLSRQAEARRCLTAVMVLATLQVTLSKVSGTFSTCAVSRAALRSEWP